MEQLKECRICKCTVEKILDLGDLALSGIFPDRNEYVPTLPIAICKCQNKNCELVQLYNIFSVEILYGETYGYRSGLNESMVQHLHNTVDKLMTYIDEKNHCNILDIGSNDGTLLNYYNRNNKDFYGIDPSANKFKNYYKTDINIINDFFTRKLVQNKKFKIITTISMFYDLPDPIEFSRDITSSLDDDGIWFTEMSYYISMIRSSSFDTICHEHLEYYRLKQLKYIADTVGLKIINIDFNDVNGGSINCIFTKKENNKFDECKELIMKILKDEEEFFKIDQIELLKQKMTILNENLQKLFKGIKNNNEIIHGYGASTKGNILLQYYNIDNKILDCIAEVNEYKFNKFTPGTNIQIVSDSISKSMRPNYYLVLPWHFRNNIIKREFQYMNNGGKLIFPLPRLEIVSVINSVIVSEYI